MRSLQLTLAYDGTAYAGWQIQPDQPTIQATLEAAWQRITGQHVRMVASGRTDAGVHALGQVVSCATDSRLPVDQLLRALNANLPQDIRVRRVDRAPDGFHATRDAVGKRYRYLLQDGPVPDLFLRSYSWFVSVRLNEQAMHRAAQALVGTFDFSSFEASGAERSTSVRTVGQLVVKRSHQGTKDTVLVEVEADGFLYNMVRNIVGTLFEVGRGSQAENWPAQVLSALDRRKAGRTAPARGLFLVEVTYPSSQAVRPDRPEWERSFPASTLGLD